MPKKELFKVKYINYSYWVELSGGTRLHTDAAKNIESGVEIFTVSNGRFIAAAKAIRAGTTFPKLIVVGDSTGTLVVLEGHLRLTAYALAQDETPAQLPVILGISTKMNHWSLF